MFGLRMSSQPLLSSSMPELSLVLSLLLMCSATGLPKSVKQQWFSFKPSAKK
jgi:hypothetical protein